MRTNRVAIIAGLTCIIGMTASAVQKQAVKSCNFDSDKAGEIASSFKQESGEWKVVADETAPSKPNVIAQLARSDEKAFNIAFLNDAVARNVDFQVKFRVAGGKIDQGGGLIWRAKNAKNHLLCRYNPLERNIRVYKVIDGTRTIIHSEENIEEVEGWQTLRIVTRDARIEGHLNGEVRFSIKNEAISDAGRVGLWSKADAQTHFDDVQLEVMD